MNSIRILTPTVVAMALASCASQKADMYDTSDPYGAPDAGYTDAAAPAYENPVYDTPAAYEESSAAPSSAYQPEAPAPAETAAYGSGAATTHTVVRGDTLSGISRKYNVPMESIKRANNMTNDIVVLGRKMVIPAR